MFWKTLKIFIALFFIPFVIALTKAFLKSLEGVNLLSANAALIISGFLAYPIFHIVLMKPMYVYAWGHEIVHVLATWLCAGKVTSFHISSAGGSVSTTKTNLFIRLSPYFVPVHTIFLVLLFWIISGFYDTAKFSNAFVFLIGFTLSLHIFMTIEVMKMRQPDIVKTGYLFSALLIYAANISVVFLVLSLIFKSISFTVFVKDTFALSKDIYSDIFAKLIK